MGALNVHHPEWRYKLRFYLGEYRLVFRILFYLKNKNTSNIVDKNTDLVLEGFPRSGNSHLYNLIRSRSKSELKIASHLHVKAQLLHGIELKKPIVVVVREPLESIFSLMLMQPKVSLKQALKLYIRYYSYVCQVVDKILVVDFELIKNQPNQALKRINERYGLNLETHMFSDSELANLTTMMKKTNETQGSKNPMSYGLPSEEKRSRKIELRSAHTDEIARYSYLMAHAKSLYTTVVG